LREENFTVVFAPICSISTGPTFQSAGTGKYATPTGHLSLHFAPLAVSYKLFPRWNQRQLDFSLRSNPKVHSSCYFRNSAWVTSGKRAAKRPLCGLFKSSWHVLPYKVHVTQL